MSCLACGAQHPGIKRKFVLQWGFLPLIVLPTIDNLTFSAANLTKWNRLGAWGMRKTIYLAAVSLFSVVTSANAGLLQWSAESEADPFTGGKKVTVDFMSTLRSGVVVFCDTSDVGIKVRAIPGFDYVDGLAGVSPTASFAIDGQKLLDADGSTGQVGNNLAAVDITLDGDKARQFVKAFAAAKKQVALKDGISDAPHLLTARGSTNAGKALAGCIEAQNADHSLVNDDTAEDGVTLKSADVKVLIETVRRSVHDASKKAGGTDALAEEAANQTEQKIRKLIGGSQ